MITVYLRCLSAFVLACLPLALAACPQVIREPAPPPPTTPSCVQGTTTCHAGHPWVCGPEHVWSRADRACARLDAGAVCCLARSPFGRAVHACVPAALCLEAPAVAADGGAL